jgi:hypothetical protein
VPGFDWDGRSRQPCPECDRGAKDTALRVTRDDLGAVAYCHRCQFTANERTERPGRPMARPAAPERHERLSDYGAWLWGCCKPVSGPARAYLEARGCVVPPADGDLRFHPALPHPPSKHIGPALVGRVTHAETREPLTLARTWVQADGQKANVDPPRMLLGGHAKKHGVIRLWPDEAVTLGLGIAEGVESALSLAHGFAPTWAAIDAGNLGALPVLAGVETLVIGADHDPAGIAAAHACAERWAAAGRGVFIVLPEPGRDINDVARAA